jgi:hypothetical protein
VLRSNRRRIILDINYNVLQGYDEKYNDIAKGYDEKYNDIAKKDS